MTAATTPSRHSQIIILGSGPAGYTAAIYAARALRKPMLIAGIQPGGQLTITTDVENYPGFADVIQGPWLMEQMRAQAIHVGTEMVEDHIIKADLQKRPFTLRPSRTLATASGIWFQSNQNQPDLVVSGSACPAAPARAARTAKRPFSRQSVWPASRHAPHSS